MWLWWMLLPQPTIITTSPNTFPHIKTLYFYYFENWTINWALHKWIDLSPFYSESNVDGREKKAYLKKIKKKGEKKASKFWLVYLRFKINATFMYVIIWSRLALKSENGIKGKKNEIWWEKNFKIFSFSFHTNKHKVNFFFFYHLNWSNW